MRTVNTTRYHRARLLYQATSRRAWHTVQPALGAIDRNILRVLERRGGATCEEIESRTGGKHQTISAQLRHMAEARLIVDSSARRTTSSGRAAIVWIIAP